MLKYDERNFFSSELKVFDIDKNGRLTETEFNSFVGEFMSDLLLEFSHKCLDNARWNANIPKSPLYDIFILLS